MAPCHFTGPKNVSISGARHPPSLALVMDLPASKALGYTGGCINHRSINSYYCTVTAARANFNNFKEKLEWPGKIQVFVRQHLLGTLL
jgi:hypothetical protein